MAGPTALEAGGRIQCLISCCTSRGRKGGPWGAGGVAPQGTTNPRGWSAT